MPSGGPADSARTCATVGDVQGDGALRRAEGLNGHLSRGTAESPGATGDHVGVLPRRQVLESSECELVQAGIDPTGTSAVKRRKIAWAVGGAVEEVSADHLSRLEQLAGRPEL